jgi:L-2-hydroxyglutarate oxidase LhgO
MEKIDVAIIGAGVIGLAVAAEIARQDRDIFIIERHSSFGQEASSRNSEVIHAGLYYPKDSLKARACLEGNRLLYEICRKYGIPHKRIGKLILATQPSELAELEALAARARENGAEDVEIIGPAQITRLQPHLQATAALYSPSTGIIDSHRLMRHFVIELESKGASIAYSTEVIGIDRLAAGYRISVRQPDGQPFSFLSRVVVNSAGLNSDTLSAMAGIYDQSYIIHPCKGDYFRLSASRSRLINRLIYPLPEAKDAGLGIHATPELGGGVRVGPDAQYIDKGKIDYSIDGKKKRQFYRQIRRLLPFVEEEDLFADTSGIRAKLAGPQEGFRDFVICHEANRGFEGFVNLVGIESPGLTASPAIARLVKGIVEDIL